MEELIETLQREMSEGAELVSCTVVLKKNGSAYVAYSAPVLNDVFIDEV